MSTVFEFLGLFITQLQKPTLAFLLGGMLLAALGSRLEIPDPIYQFIVLLLLLKIGMGAGLALRAADPVELLLPALAAMSLGLVIVLLGRITLCLIPSVQKEDGIATAGLFGAVSVSTLAAAMVIMEEDAIAYEAWAPALYPFMDIPALLAAIVLAKMARRGKGSRPRTRLRSLILDSLRGSALSALLLGIALGLLTRPDPVFESFYEPLFRGLLSLLMLVMGMEAYARLAELRRVAHVYAAYGLLAPLLHGALGFSLGWAIHLATGFSPGGVVMLAVMAASSSDVSGPPTLRVAIPSANPAVYIGTSTSVGTPVALLSIPLWMTLAELLLQP